MSNYLIFFWVKNCTGSLKDLGILKTQNAGGVLTQQQVEQMMVEQTHKQAAGHVIDSLIAKEKKGTYNV